MKEEGTYSRRGEERKMKWWEERGGKSLEKREEVVGRIKGKRRRTFK